MTTVLNVKIDPKVKTQAGKIAQMLGMSLSGVVNVYMREFVRTKTLSVSLQNEEPSESLLLAMRAVQADIKAGRVYKFESGARAIEFLRRRRLAGRSS